MVTKAKIQMLVEHEDGSEEFVMQCYTRETECAVLLSMPNAKFTQSLWDGMKQAIEEALKKGVAGEAGNKPGDIGKKELHVVPPSESKH